MSEQILDFERILALSYKACKYIEYKYGVDINLSEEKALDVWSKHKDSIESLADYSIRSKNESEKKIYFLFKDNIRTEVGIYQIKNSEGKKVWYSPFVKHEVYDTADEDFIGLEVFDMDIRKKIFYEHRNDFRLNNQELAFIDLVFSGYNPTNIMDVLVFKEMLETDSSGYVKTFFNRLCKKVEAEALRIGLK